MRESVGEAHIRLVRLYPLSKLKDRETQCATGKLKIYYDVPKRSSCDRVECIRDGPRTKELEADLQTQCVTRQTESVSSQDAMTYILKHNPKSGRRNSDRCRSTIDALVSIGISPNVPDFRLHPATELRSYAGLPYYCCRFDTGLTSRLLRKSRTSNHRQSSTF